MHHKFTASIFRRESNEDRLDQAHYIIWAFVDNADKDGMPVNGWAPYDLFVSESHTTISTVSTDKNYDVVGSMNRVLAGMIPHINNGDPFSMPDKIEFEADFG